MTNTASALQFVVGEKATLAAHGATPETLVTIVSTKGRWVQVRADFLGDDGEVINVARARLSPAPESQGLEVDPTSEMHRLRRAVTSGKYTKAKNGQYSCGDELAQILGQLEPNDVVRACMIALDLTTNPYTHLNVGQQSMNLRNRIRRALAQGQFGMGVVREAVEEVLPA